MIYGTTTNPSLVAGIMEMNAVSAREEAYKAKISELEEKLAETQKRLEFYMTVWGIQADQYTALRKDYIDVTCELVSLQAADAERRARRHAAVMAGKYEQPRRAGGWI